MNEPVKTVPAKEAEPADLSSVYRSASRMDLGTLLAFGSLAMGTAFDLSTGKTALIAIATEIARRIVSARWPDFMARLEPTEKKPEA